MILRIRKGKNTYKTNTTARRTHMRNDDRCSILNHGHTPSKLDSTRERELSTPLAPLSARRPSSGKWGEFDRESTKTFIKERPSIDLMGIQYSYSIHAIKRIHRLVHAHLTASTCALHMTSTSAVDANEQPFELALSQEDTWWSVKLLQQPPLRVWFIELEHGYEDTIAKYGPYDEHVKSYQVI